MTAETKPKTDPDALKINLDEFILAGENVLVRRDRPKEVTEGGILLPDSAKDAPEWATVVRVGLDVKPEHRRHVREGCRAIFRALDAQNLPEIGGLVEPRSGPARGSNFCEYAYVNAKDIVLVSKDGNP